MEVLYISTSCSSKKYQDVYNMRKVKTLEPQQKFNNLIIRGIASCEDVHVTALSALPVSETTCDASFFNREVEFVNDSLEYIYIAFRNGKITRPFDLCKNALVEFKKWVNKYSGKELVVIADVLSIYMLWGILKAANKRNIPVVGIVTDLPELTTNMKSRKMSRIKQYLESLIQHKNTQSLEKYNGYITLTQSIYDAINPKHTKPNLIVEGSVDSSLKYNKQILDSKPVVVYAGGAYEKYGLRTLVEAFLSIDNAELHIYGEGTYVEEIKEISQTHPNIQYMGLASLEEIVSIEQRASLLINPRPSNEEFSKYSFPSKTLEYMSSGTPLLSTMLPGIPKEYFQYIRAISPETTDGMFKSICELLSLSNEDLIEIGRKAYDFVMSKKTNTKQGASIVSFIKEQFYA